MSEYEHRGRGFDWSQGTRTRVLDNKLTAKFQSLHPSPDHVQRADPSEHVLAARPHEV